MRRARRLHTQMVRNAVDPTQPPHPLHTALHSNHPTTANTQAPYQATETIHTTHTRARVRTTYLPDGLNDSSAFCALNSARVTTKGDNDDDDAVVLSLSLAAALLLLSQAAARSLRKTHTRPVLPRASAENVAT